MVLLWHRGNHIGSERKYHCNQKALKSAPRTQQSALKLLGFPGLGRTSFGALEEPETPQGRVLAFRHLTATLPANVTSSFPRRAVGTVSGHFQRPKEHTGPRVPLEAGGAGGALLGTAPALPSQAVRWGSRLSRRLSQSD